MTTEFEHTIEQDTIDSMDPNYLQVQIKKLHKIYLNEQEKARKLKKRLNESESQRLVVISENNKIIFGLNSQCTKMRADLEKSEALRQTLEYETSLLKDKTSSVINENNQFKAQLETIEMKYTKELEKLRISLEEKEKNLAKLQNEEDFFAKERQSLNTFIKEQERVNAQLKDENIMFKDINLKMSLQVESAKDNEETLKKENQSLSEKIRQLAESYTKERNEYIEIKTNFDKIQDKNKEMLQEERDKLDGLMNEHKHLKEKEEMYKKDIEMLNSKIRFIDDAFDKEKAAFLDLKINFDKLQAKWKETQEQLTTKENLRMEIEMNMIKLIEQLKENRKELSEEQGRNRDIKERFKLCENQLKSMNNELTLKLEEKSNVIKSLSTQLTSYEANLDDIKHELQQMHERHHEIDKVYDKCTKELDCLTRAFQVKHVTYEDTKSSKAQAMVSSHTIVDKIEQLKKTLDDYKKHNQQINEQLKEAKSQHDIIHSELAIAKKAVESKDKYVTKYDDLKTKYENELQTLRKEHVALEDVISSLRVQCDTLKSSLDREYESNEKLKQKQHRQGEGAMAVQIIKKKLQPIFAIFKIDMNDDRHLLDNLMDKLKDYINATDKNLTEYEHKMKTNEKNIEQITQTYDEQLQKTLKLLKEKEIVFHKQKESLVKYYEQLVNDANARVKETHVTANDVEHKNKFKDGLEKAEVQIRCLNTSCAFLVGALMPIIRQNKELVQQRNLFAFLYQRCRNELMEKCLLNLKSGTSQTTRAIIRFRKAVVVVLAANRLCHFNKIFSKTQLDIADEALGTRYKFLYSQVTMNESPKALRFGLTKKDTGNDDMNNYLGKPIADWFTSNNQMPALIEIGNEINRHLYKNNSSEIKIDMDYCLQKTTKNCLLKLYAKLNKPQAQLARTISLPIIINNVQKHNYSLCQRLQSGIDGLISKELLIDNYYSTEKIINNLAKKLIDLDKTYQVSKMNNDEKLKAHETKTVKLEKFEILCKELDASLKREQRAEHLLNKQNIRLEELSKKLANSSTDDMEMIKNKEALQLLQIELEKKNKVIKTLMKRLNNAKNENDNFEEASRNNSIEKDVFFAYCQRIQILIQDQMKPLLLNDQYRDVLEVTKQIMHIEVLPNKEYQSTIESAACQNLLALFCDNYEIILRKMISSEDEIDGLRKQLANIKDEFMLVLNSQSLHRHQSETQHARPKSSPNEFETSELSFRQLPNFSTQSTSYSSAFKPLPVRLMSSSTPTSSSMNS